MDLTKEPNFSQGRSYCSVRGCLFYWLKRILWCVFLSVFKNVTHQYHKLLLCMCRQNILLLVCPRSCRIPQQRCHWTCTTFLYTHCHLHHSFWEKKYENKAKWTTTTKKQNKKINVTGIRILSKSYYSMMFSVLFFHDLRLSTSRCSRNEFLEESKTESEKMTEIEAKDRGACFSMCCESLDGGRVLLWPTKQLFLLMTNT